METTTMNKPILLLEYGPGGNHSVLEPILAEIKKAFPDSRKYCFGQTPLSNRESSFCLLDEKNILGVLERLATMHPGSDIFRIHPHGRLLPSSLLDSFLDFHVATGNRYSFMDLDELAFYHTFLELFNTEFIRNLLKQKRPLIPPDHSLNAFDFKNWGVMNLSRKNALYFMDERFDAFFPRPVNLNLEISSICIARCMMCHFDKANGIGLVDNPPPFMDFKLFVKIIDEVSTWARKPTVDLCWRGEPLMNPQLVGYIRYARGKGVPIIITTNASLLSGKLTEALLGLGILQIVFSLDGITAKTYEKIRRGLKYEEVKGNIEHFIDLRERKYNSTKTTVSVKACCQEENEGEIDDLVNYWAPRVDNVIVQNKGIYERKTRHAYSYRAFVKKDFSRAPCPQPFLIQSVTATGRVYDCLIAYSKDDPYMGNCKMKSLEELWHSNSVQTKRRYMLEGRYDELPVCAGCDISSSTATIRKEIVGDILIQYKHFCKIYSKL